MERNPKIIVSKYEWEIEDCGQFHLAKRNDDNKKYLCQIIDLKSIKKYENYITIVQIEDTITINNKNYIFYEFNPIHVPINEKKLIETFMDLKTTYKDICVYYTFNKIIHENGLYKICPSLVFKKLNSQSIKRILLKIFKDLDLRNEQLTLI